MKKIPQRTCMGCNEKKNKTDLLRIVFNSNKLVIDKTGKLQGRGAYICNNEQCLTKLIKSKRLERIFETKIEENIYNDIRGVIIEEKDYKTQN